MIVFLASLWTLLGNIVRIVVVYWNRWPHISIWWTTRLSAVGNFWSMLATPPSQIIKTKKVSSWLRRAFQCNILPIPSPASEMARPLFSQPTAPSICLLFISFESFLPPNSSCFAYFMPLIKRIKTQMRDKLWDPCSSDASLLPHYSCALLCFCPRTAFVVKTQFLISFSS